MFLIRLKIVNNSNTNEPWVTPILDTYYFHSQPVSLKHNDNTYLVVKSNPKEL